MFSLEQRNITCLAGNEHEIAVGDSDSHVTIYGTVDWSMKCNLTVPMEERVKILSLQYGKINRRQGQPQLVLLMVSALPRFIHHFELDTFKSVTCSSLM